MIRYALPALLALTLTACDSGSDPAGTPAFSDPDAPAMDMSTVDTEAPREEAVTSAVPGTAEGVTVTDSNDNSVTIGPGAATATLSAEEIDARFGASGVKVETSEKR